MKNASTSSISLFFALFLLGWCTTLSVQSQNSVLQSGTWYKLAIEKNGVYKIDQSLLRRMGFDPAKTDPRKIKIYGNEGGMLPQANSTARPTDLIENAILVHGESDGVFNSGDYVLFYAQGPDKSYFNKNKGIFFYEKNLYADKNFYFFTVGDSNGKRISTTENIAGTFPIVNQFENFSYYELDQHSELKSGREWYGEKFDLTLEFKKDIELGNIVPGSNIKLVSDVMAKGFSNSSFTVFINGTQILQQTIAAIPNTLYGIKGRDKRDTVTVNANTIGTSGRINQEVMYRYTRSNTNPVGYLDYFLFQATQQLALYNQQTSFRSTISLQNPASTFEIAGAQSQTSVWDVSNPYEPLLQASFFTSGKILFSTITSTLKEFIAFSSPLTPTLIGAVPNQNLHGIAVPDFLIVVHPDFRSEAERLAAHRASINGMASTVVTTEKVYNEFSSGRPDVTAIRDFAKSLYDRSPSTLKAILLFGKGSYDYKNRMDDNTNFVPIYESRSSLNPLTTYSSDDYFAFLENHEGEWSEEPVVNHSMDISVGRFPVKTATEAQRVVDKIFEYDLNPELLGKWRKEITFVADDGDFNLHQDDANQLAESINDNHAAFNTRKIFLDQYPQESRPSGQVSPETEKRIEEAFYNGSLVINYTGHGNEKLWADEHIFDDIMIASLENKRLPLMVTATCEFGRQDDPEVISGAEMMLLREGGGAISLVTTSRPVNAATNFLLNEAFYNAFFQQENDDYLLLGEIFRRTKNSSMSGVANRNFSLVGDPSLRLAIPKLNLKVTEITTASGSTDLKALSTVTVKGEVVNAADQVVTPFNGVVESVLYDKETSFVTLGDENNPYPFQQWFNALFRGKATVKDGVFEFKFIVPKNIAYTLGEGKLSLYAYDTLNDVEASGFSQDFQIGLSEVNPEVDTSSPLLALYMGDTTFVNGGIANPNTTLIGRLADLHGINISGYGIGNSIIGALDDQQTFVLNDYYEADLDDFTKGTITFPLQDLSPGRHTITVKAWDTYNNPVQSSVDFLVSENTALEIETFGNYPNPFQTSTSLFFTHNRSGDDLEASVVLYDYTGHVIESYQINIPNSGYHVELMTLHNGNNNERTRPSGLYFARLMVRSISDGSKNEQVTKLIILN